MRNLSDNDSERDGKEEDDTSDNDLEMLGEQSGTTDETNSTGDASGGTEAPAKKVKTMLTQDQETFAKMFLPRGKGELRMGEGVGRLVLV